MGFITQFDVLVVYSSSIASSASLDDFSTPFSAGSKREDYNYPYAYFMTQCAQKNLRAAFSTSKDISAPGQCSSYWMYEDNQWTRHKDACTAPIIFDKFSPVTEKQRIKRELFFSSPSVQPFNDPLIFSLFFDKHKMYQALAPFSVPTVTITIPKMQADLKKLQELVAAHSNRADFGHGIIIKDRFGAGGIHIYKLTQNIVNEATQILNRYPRISFIAQPFAKFDTGFKYQNLLGSTDIRLIYQGKKIVQTYIRMAKAGDFRCNEHQGGTLTYIPLKAIPSKVIRFANQIANRLTNHEALFALDFIVSNHNNVYLLEGNTGPGLDWNLALKKNERMAKKLIRIIVGNIGKRSAALSPPIYQEKRYPLPRLPLAL